MLVRPWLVLCAIATCIADSSIIHATALYDFFSTEEDELSIRRGDTVLVLGSVDGEDEWLRVQASNGDAGLVPLAYISV